MNFDLQKYTIVQENTRKSHNEIKMLSHLLNMQYYIILYINM